MQRGTGRRPLLNGIICECKSVYLTERDMKKQAGKAEEQKDESM